MSYPTITKITTAMPNINRLRKGVKINVDIPINARERLIMRKNTLGSHLPIISPALSSRSSFSCILLASARSAHLVISGKGSLSSRGFLLNMSFYSTPTGGCQAWRISCYPPHTKRSTDSPTRIKLSGKRRGLTINMPIAAAIKRESAMRIKTRLITLSSALSIFSALAFSSLVGSSPSHFENVGNTLFHRLMPFYSTSKGGCQA